MALARFHIKQAWNNLTAFFFSFRAIPLFLFIVCFVSFGIFLPWMGFYWDDWPFIWFAHALNPAALIKIEIHRPLSGVVFALGAALLGENPFPWQAMMFLARWLSGVAFVWAWLKLWPNQKHQILWAALFFLVYPGFRQQYVAVNTSRHLLPLIFYLLSLGFMIGAIKKPEKYWPYTILALILALIQLMTTEYYFGLELLRPVILWFAQDIPPFSLKKFSFNWLPYLLLVGLFLFWRLFIFNVGYYPVTLFNALRANPGQALTQLAQTIFRDVVNVSVGAWGQVFHFPSVSFYSVRPVLYYGGVVLVVGVGLFLLLRRLPQTHSGTSTQWAWQACIIGLVALFCGGWPFWAINELTIKLTLPWDRLTLPMSLGVSLLLAGLIELVGQRPPIRIFLVTLLVSLAVGFQFMNGLDFRRDWQLQKNFLNQLTWRIPALQPNTLLLNNQLPSVSTDNSLTAAINWLYAPPLQEDDPLPYMLVNADLRLGKSLQTLEEGIGFEKVYRVFPFLGSTSQALVLYYAPPACLRILDPTVDAQYPYLPEVYRQALPLSQPQNILPTAPASHTPQFLDVPTQNVWCYTYEKADLARQTGEWDAILTLAESAPFNTLQRQNAPELLPFIETFARTGAWSKARQFTQTALQLDPLLQPMLCDNWTRLANALASSDKPAEFLADLNCPAPAP